MFSLCPNIKRPAKNLSDADVDDQAADGVDAGTVAGVEHRRRRDLLDDRRPRDLVAGEERLTAQGERLVPLTAAWRIRLEIDPAGPAACVVRRRGAADGGTRQFG